MPFTQTRDEGLLITGTRRYRVMVAVLFGGRRSALDRVLADASGARPGDRVVDVGCGPGRLLRRLAARVGPSGEAVGVDPSEPMLAEARRRARGQAATCRFTPGAAQDLPLPADSCDVVTSTFAMHHIAEKDRETALAEMARVLRPGGRVLIADAYPTGRVAPAVVRALARMMRHAGDTDPAAETDVRQYAEAVRAVGFTDLAFTDVPPWTRFVTGVKGAEGV